MPARKFHGDSQKLLASGMPRCGAPARKSLGSGQRPGSKQNADLTWLVTFA